MTTEQGVEWVIAMRAICLIMSILLRPEASTSVDGAEEDPDTWRSRSATPQESEFF